MLEREFELHVKASVEAEKRARLIGNVGAVLTLGFWKNSHGISRGESATLAAQKDLETLNGTMPGITELRLRLAAFQTLNGVRVSVCAFPDLEIDGKQTYGPEWDRLRDVILHRDGRECQHSHIGQCNGPLQIHHVRWLSKGGTNAPENLITLCRRHHGLQHPDNPAFRGD